ncbi:YheO domain protein [Mannheimia sp. USDA-ARS-USMARC-1261]|uniref:helix-turn-helix transcriptional regulator n=1 Tax=Mannheimia sp. USDA-ARS-USMARC-1261 TaxID=1432056 RepID=UPI0003E3A7D7|nr:PAS domain-containing protein [Mannheimia sp. USDA-ARS-USMARC-1261]AHG74340.1 YheO domain protein [Mannheimia sp. USDA-ARS-USMARC-1261]
MTERLDYLDDIDQEIMQSYFSLSEAVAGLLGEFCEVVIHSLNAYENSIIKIINGHHTNRKVGSPITDKGLQLLKSYQKDKSSSKQVYFSRLNNGNLIKSTTHIIIGHKGVPIGLFCINLNLSTPLDKTVSSFMANDPIPLYHKSENFITQPKELIEETFYKAITEIEQHTAKNSKLYKKSIIFYLFENGIFELKDAVPIVAEKLSLTSHAIYKHLREFKNNI